jgi:CTP:phosphocholine cytidylyltransferase-like protein
MKGGCTEYPNKGVKIDPRSITSVRMPESLKVYSGFLNHAFYFLKENGYMCKKIIERETETIESLLPYSKTKNKLRSSHWFNSDMYRIEFFRTSTKNFKVYAFKLFFIEEFFNLPE